MQSIFQHGQAEQTLNKSRFIAVAESCVDERAVMLLLRGLAQAHSHAHHLAFAYRLKNPEGQGCLVRSHDAGEPSGTAGRPILQYIEGFDLVNACVAVVRYYGGINLGTGGLARAYGSTAKMALDAAQLGPYVEMRQLRLVVEYAQLDGVVRDVGKLGGQVLDKGFEERVTVVVSVPVADVAGMQQKYHGR